MGIWALAATTSGCSGPRPASVSCSMAADRNSCLAALLSTPFPLARAAEPPLPCQGPGFEGTYPPPPGDSASS
eukprot:2151701-Pyramimonas_sp.AAC.1